MAQITDFFIRRRVSGSGAKPSISGSNFVIPKGEPIMAVVSGNYVSTVHFSWYLSGSQQKSQNTSSGRWLLDGLEEGNYRIKVIANDANGPSQVEYGLKIVNVSFTGNATDPVGDQSSLSSSPLVYSNEDTEFIVRLSPNVEANLQWQVTDLADQVIVEKHTSYMNKKEWINPIKNLSFGKFYVKCIIDFRNRVEIKKSFEVDYQEFIPSVKVFNFSNIFDEEDDFIIV